jgi:SAM-dependent methyltransferase
VVRAAGDDPDERAARTLRDFGEQWALDGENDGFYGSLDLLRDALGPLLELSEFRGARIAGVGSGAGRIVRMLLDAGAAHVTALEPSAGVEVLRRNTAEQGERVRVLHMSGEALPPGLELDFVTAIGVLPFVPDPEPLLRAARAALRPGGRIVNIDYQKRATPVGPPLGHRIARDEFLRDARSAGLALAAEPRFLPYQYFLVLKPR